MKNETLVTVVMPTYNAGRFIGKAIESILLQELDGKIQVIIVDDNSADDTSDIVKKMQVQAGCDNKNVSIEYVVNDTRLGVAGSRNCAVTRAKGEYIAFLDSDDWWENDKLKKQIDALERYRNVPLCCSGRELMDNDGNSTGRCIGVKPQITYDMLLKTNSIACSSVVIRTDIAKRHLMHNDELHEDYICWLEILKEYGYAMGIDEPLLKSRMSVGGKSRNKFKSMKMNYGVYRLIGMGRFKALYYTVWYIVNGLKKYYG